LDCSFHALTSLDVSACTALTYLDCRESFWLSLTSLNVSGCTALINLDCTGNSLSSLDVSSCTALTNLYCSNNQLTSLNVKNGNNINMVSINDKGQQFYGFLASNNPNLSCIEVDNTAWSNINWPYIDPTASFSENCSGVGITDNNESNAPIFYPNPTTGTIYLSEPANITLSDLSGKLLLEEKNTNQLDISALPAGMYFLNVGENNQQTFKVIKE
jgi:Leucine-rich repeat (LRR) protein